MLYSKFQTSQEETFNSMPLKCVHFLTWEMGIVGMASNVVNTDRTNPDLASPSPSWAPAADTPCGAASRTCNNSCTERASKIQRNFSRKDLTKSHA